MNDVSKNPKDSSSFKTIDVFKSSEEQTDKEQMTVNIGFEEIMKVSAREEEESKEMKVIKEER